MSQAHPEHPAPEELILLVIERQPTVTGADAVKVSVVGEVMVMAAGTAHCLSA